MKDFLQISKERYTTKHYDATKKISDKDFETLLEFLRLAPSAVNVQPWYFYTGSTQKAKDFILPCIPDFNIPRVEESSHFVVICARTELNEDFLNSLTVKEELDGRFPSEKIKEAIDSHRKSFSNMHKELGDLKEWTAKQAYIAMTALLYGAASMGIDSTPIEGMDFDKADELLGLKGKGLKTVAMVTLGYRAQDDSNATRPKSRLSKAQVFSSLD